MCMEDKVLEIEQNSIESLVKHIQLTDSKNRSLSIADGYYLNSDHITDLIKDSKVINDAYSNSITGAGTENSIESFTNYGYSNDTLNYPLWLCLYNDSWVFKKAIDKPSQDMIKCGFTIHGDEDYTKVYQLYNRYKSDLTHLLMWGALFGGSVGVLQFEGFTDKDYIKPLNKSKIKGARFKIYVTDRWYGGFAKTDKMVTNMKDIDYGKPYYYDITFPNGKTFTVHHSYILRYEHRVAPPLIKNGQLQGWGYAEGAHILNELSRDDQLKSAITSLVNKSLIEVVKMSGMRGVFMGSDKGNEAQLRKRLEMVNWGRNYNSLTFLDKDDEYQQYQLSALQGLADIMEKNMWLIAAALDMPGVLYGELKGGLSADTDAYEHYSDVIEDRCNSYYRPVLNKFLKILFMVAGVEGPVDFDFNPLAAGTKNKQKIETVVALSNMLSTLNDNKIISKYQYGMTIQNFLNKNVINLNIPEEYLNKLKLEEEQEILDSIKELNGKGRNITAPNFDNQTNRTMPVPNMRGNFEEESFDNLESSENSEPVETMSGENINEASSPENREA